MAFMSNLRPLSGGALALLVLACIASIVSLSTNYWETASGSGGKTNFNQKIYTTAEIKEAAMCSLVEENPDLEYINMLMWFKMYLHFIFFCMNMFIHFKIPYIACLLKCQNISR